MKVKSMLQVFPKDPDGVKMCHFLLYDKYPVIRIVSPFGSMLINRRNTIFELEDYSVTNITMKFTKKMYYEN
jgi:hypothetical protein